MSATLRHKRNFPQALHADLRRTDLAHDTYPGATFLDFAFVGGLSIALALAVAPIATNTTRIFGTRATLLVGVVLETLSLISASFAKQIWQLFLSQGICFVSVAGCPDEQAVEC